MQDHSQSTIDKINIDQIDFQAVKDTGWIDLASTGILNTALVANHTLAKYGPAEIRVRDGFVVMRGLILRNSGNWVAGDTIMRLPASLTPRTERRFNCQTVTIRIGDRTSGTPGTAGYPFGLCLLDGAGATGFLVLDMVQYYVN